MMSNLRLLKEKEEFQGLSIRDDFTITERNVIKEYVAKAKVKNDAEENPNYEWKIRGDPRKGVILKRYAKRNTTKEKLKDDSLGTLQNNFE